MGAAPNFRLFPVEKFEELKASMHLVTRIDKRRILGIFPTVKEINALYEFINYQTTDITFELENITYDLEDVTHEFMDVAELGPGYSNSIGYFWFNQYLLHEKKIDLFSEPGCKLSHNTDGRGGKTSYAVHDHRLSTELLIELNRLNMTKKSFDKFAEETAKEIGTLENPINPTSIRNYYMSVVISYVLTKEFLGRINESLMGLLVLPPEYL